MKKSIEDIRRQINEIDKQIIHLASKRRQLASEIGQKKQQLNIPLRDFTREKICIDNNRQVAKNTGLPQNSSDQLTKTLISDALLVQEKNKLQQVKLGQNKRICIIGGNGQMGQWFVTFCQSMGYDVFIADIDKKNSNKNNYNGKYIDDWTKQSLDFDAIIVATSLRKTNNILKTLADKKPKSIIVDIASLKQPCTDGLMLLKNAGLQVVSIHPMFGPKTALLSGHHIVIIDFACQKATEFAYNLFSPTMAKIIPLKLKEHDAIMSYLLGLSHIINILFLSTLKQSGYEASLFAKLSSATFSKQLAVSTEVIGENPQLYFDIQALNPHSLQMLNKTKQVLNELIEMANTKDEEKFVKLMTSCKKFFINIEKDFDGN